MISHSLVKINYIVSFLF